MKSQSGFTLIEMVVVIIILAIMAATAMPRFVNLSGESRMSALAGMNGAMASAKDLVKSKWLAANSANLANVDVGGTFVSVVSSLNAVGGADAQGAPVLATSGMWTALDNPSGFSSALTVASGLTLWPTGVTISTNCYTYYSAGQVVMMVSSGAPNVQPSVSCL